MVGSTSCPLGIHIVRQRSPSARKGEPQLSPRPYLARGMDISELDRFELMLWSSNSAKVRPIVPVVVQLIGIIILAVVVAGCSPATTASAPSNQQNGPSAESKYIADPADYVFPDEVEATAAVIVEPTPAAEEEIQVVISTGGSRANLRSAPDVANSEIVGKGNVGDVFTVVSQSEDGEWYEICCIAGEDDADGEATATAWVATTLVSTDAATAEIPIAEGTEPILPQEIEAEWAVDWQCNSDRCTVDECQASVVAAGANPDNQRWIAVDHVVTWDNSCFPPDQWVFEIDQFMGSERTGDFDDNFLYSYWLGAESGDFNGVYQMDDERNVAVWCSGPYNVEINEGDGWATVYEGRTCHDLKTGMITLLSYTKRWLYTGEFDGQTYDRAYFGDSETLEQRLIETNVELAYVEPAQ